MHQVNRLNTKRFKSYMLELEFEFELDFELDFELKKIELDMS